MDGASTSGQQHAPGSMLSYFWQLIGWRQHQQVGSAGEDDAPPPKAYLAALAAANDADCAAGGGARPAQDDWADLDALRFLDTAALKDPDGRPVVLVLSKQYPAGAASLERLYRYVVQRCDSLSCGPYSVLWVHTGATYWANCPSVLWLWSTLHYGLPPRWRSNLQRLHILHPDLSLWATLSAASAAAPLMAAATGAAAGISQKIEYVSRVEFLHAAVAGGRAALLAALPPYVHEHDAELEEQPLLDYGVVAPLAQQFQPGGSQAAAGGGGGMPPAPPLVGMPVPM